MIGLCVAVVYTNMLEWFLHKYLLHGVGGDKASFWSFHWHEHHRESRKGNMFDGQYDRPLFIWRSPQLKEAFSVVLGVVVHVPFAFISPIFFAYIVLHGVRYYVLHRRAHVDREWCMRNAPWHYDHHMGKDQNANWCVTHPWFDHVMGTRKTYVYDEKGKPIAELTVPVPRTIWARVVRPIFAGRFERVRLNARQIDFADAA